MITIVRICLISGPEIKKEKKKGHVILDVNDALLKCSETSIEVQSTTVRH